MKHERQDPMRGRIRRATTTLFALGALSIAGQAQVLDPAILQNHEGNAEHVDQADLMALVGMSDDFGAFELAFELGDELFEVEFNAIDGGGANVGNGERFTRVPRADLTGPGQWADHFPMRATGPNSSTCVSCHNKPTPDGAGEPSSNVHRDPTHGGIGRFINRNTPILFGTGPAQRLAEEMTEELHAIRDAAIAQSWAMGSTVFLPLEAKGVSFGVIGARGDSVKTRLVEGVDSDLVVRPFQWKGNFATIREFNRDASHQELGMQAVEIVGGMDGDSDGVSNEMTVGDQTALAIYLAGQPRPVTNRELADAGVIPALDPRMIALIEAGGVLFGSVGCAECHVPEMILNDPVFSEPSWNPNYRDTPLFPSGMDPIAAGVNPATPVKFDMTTEVLDNIIPDGMGGETHLGVLESNGKGGAIVRIFSDLKRHDLGPGIREQIDETGVGRSVFLTEALWGCGSTAPYFHDGRATTLTEAVLFHGGDASASRTAFLDLSADDQAAVIAFLNDMVIFLDGE